MKPIRTLCRTLIRTRSVLVLAVGAVLGPAIPGAMAASGTVLQKPAADTMFFAAETPKALPAPGVYKLPISVALVSATAGASILYTTDGSMPATSQTGSTKMYVDSIHISSNVRIQSIAVKTGLYASAIATAEYVFSATALTNRRAGIPARSRGGSVGGGIPESNPPEAKARFDAMGVFLGWARPFGAAETFTRSPMR